MTFSSNRVKIFALNIKKAEEKHESHLFKSWNYHCHNVLDYMQNGEVHWRGQNDLVFFRNWLLTSGSSVFHISETCLVHNVPRVSVFRYWSCRRIIMEEYSGHWGRIYGSKTLPYKVKVSAAFIFCHPLYVVSNNWSNLHWSSVFAQL